MGNERREEERCWRTSRRGREKRNVQGGRGLRFVDASLVLKIPLYILFL